jgi:hypothetical protein
VIYAQAPVSNTMTLGQGDVAGGCDGGALTIQGAGLAGIFGIGAVAIAALVAIDPSRRRPPAEAPTEADLPSASEVSAEAEAPNETGRSAPAPPAETRLASASEGSS